MGAGGGGGVGTGWGGGGGWSSLAQAPCSESTLRASRSTTAANDSKVRGAPELDAEEMVDGSTGDDGGAVDAGAGGGSVDVGGGPDIADTRLLGTLALPRIGRRL